MKRIKHKEKKPKEIIGAKWSITSTQKNQAVTQTGKGVFDSLVVERWLHIERMTPNLWWMVVGHLEINVSVDARGRSTCTVRDLNKVENAFKLAK